MVFFTLEFFIIVGIWAVIWTHLLIIKPAKELPQDPYLKRNSKLVIINIFLFYTVSFNSLTAISLPLTQTFNNIVSITCLLLGMSLFIISRQTLRDLSYSDIMFSYNPTYISSGIYKYLSHPMYVGMTLILVGSWLVFPTILGALFIITFLFLIKKKSNYETKVIN